MPTNDGQSLKILFAASEAQPYIKTGGLADVAGSLPIALSHFGHDVRVVLPAYPQAVEKAIPLTAVATLKLPGIVEKIRILEAKMAPGVTLYLVDAPGYFDRPGNPYVNAAGHDWHDNPERFTLFCRAIVQLSLDHAGLNWKPDIVHCNDWQTGLVPALLSDEWNRPATLFTIHNLAYQGVYDHPAFARVGLPKHLWSVDGLEFHGNFSFIKGGIAFSDWVTTVSPTYAEEILTPEYGYGLEGLLEHRKPRLSGVLNGIDFQAWNPATDPSIIQSYDAATFQLKRRNKVHLQQKMGLNVDEHALLFGHIGRVVEQKGIDLIIEMLPQLMAEENTQLVVLGSGNRELEHALESAAAQYQGRLAVRIGYDEELAHQIEAGCDSFLMPSRFEPCGLNQLYSLRYGSVPLVRKTGGLADTVVDATPGNLMNGSATGFVFDNPDVDSLWECLQRMLELRQRPAIWWQKLAVSGMEQDFSWDNSAKHYLELYQQAIDQPAPSPISKAAIQA
jgi:starch synthase